MQSNIDQIMAMISKDFRSISSSMEGLEKNAEGDFIVPGGVLLSMVGVLRNVVTGLQKAQNAYAISRYQNTVLADLEEGARDAPVYSETAQ